MPREVACRVSGPSARSRPPPCGSGSSARGCDPYSGNTAGAPGGGGMRNHWLRPASGQSGTESHVQLPALNVVFSQALSPAGPPPRPTPLGRRFTQRNSVAGLQRKNNGCTTSHDQSPESSKLLQAPKITSLLGVGGTHGQEEDQLLSDAQWLRPSSEDLSCSYG